MISGANQKAIEAAGLPFILGMRIPHVPYVVAHWQREHPGEEIPDGCADHYRAPVRTWTLVKREDLRVRYSRLALTWPNGR